MTVPRYTAVEIDGVWYVMDRKDPASLSKPEISEIDAENTARVWNTFCSQIQEEEGDDTWT